MSIKNSLRIIFLGLFLIIFQISSAQDFKLKSGVTKLPALHRVDATWGDIDKDGLMDLFMCGVKGTDRQTSIYKNNGDDSFGTFGFTLEGVSDGAILPIDLNNDDFLDVIVSGKTDTTLSFKIYKNGGNGTLVDIPTDIPPMFHSDIISIDYDNDGKRDLFVMGTDKEGKPISKLFTNKGQFVLQESGFEFVQLTDGEAISFDYNHDLYPDILYTGIDTKGARYTFLYENQYGKTFKTVDQLALPKVTRGTVTVGDYDNDSWEDLFISGSEDNITYISKVFRNVDGSGTFAEVEDFDGVHLSTAVWGDFQNDGKADITFSGEKNDGSRFHSLFINATPNFVQSPLAFPGVTKGAISAVDYNNDNKLDLFIIGGADGSNIVNLYKSIITNANKVPNAPSNLRFESKVDSLILEWDPSKDDKTSPEGLSYNIYLGTSPKQGDVVYPYANITNGKRYLSQKGDWKTHKAIIKELPEGKYYWSVQAIDPAMGASPFAKEGIAYICDEVDAGPDQEVCELSNVKIKVGTPDDRVRWLDLDDPSAVLGTGSPLNYQITRDITVIAEVTKPLGCIKYDTVIVKMNPLPKVVLEDQKVCLGTTVILSTGERLEGDKVKWYSASEGFIQDSDTLEYTVTKDEKIKVEVENKKGCITTVEIQLTMVPLPVVDLGKTKQACVGETIELNTGTRQAGDVVDWYSSQKGLIKKNAKRLDYKVISDVDSVWAEVRNTSTNCRQTSTVIIMPMQLPKADAGKDRYFCRGQAEQLGGDYRDFPYYTFQWSPTTGLDDPSIANPMAIPQYTTTYQLTVTNTQTGCINRDEVTLSLDDPTTVTVQSDTSICKGTSIPIGGQPTAIGSHLEYTYKWHPITGLDDPEVASPIASPLQTTLYTVEVYTGQCKVGEATTNIKVRPVPVLDVKEDTISIGKGEEALLGAVSDDPNVIYKWYPTQGLNFDNIPNPVAQPEQSTTYTVTVTNSTGCITEQKIVILVENRLFVPTLFTPNEDGRNDFFKIYGYGIESIVVRVFNRAGQMVFESTDVEEMLSKGWDGTYDGMQAPNGIYIWTLEGKYKDGTSLSYKGKNTGKLSLLR